jgi:hypothetical protein
VKVAVLVAIVVSLYLVSSYWAREDIGINASANSLALLMLYLPAYSVLFSLLAVMFHILARLLKLLPMIRLFIVLGSLVVGVALAYYYVAMRS